MRKWGFFYMHHLSFDISPELWGGKYYLNTTFITLIKKRRETIPFLSWGQLFFREYVGLLQPFTLSFYFFTEQQQIIERTDHRPPATPASWKKGWKFLALCRSQARFCTYSDIYLKLINGFVLTELMLRKKTTCQQAGHLIQTRVPGGQTSESSKTLFLWAFLAWASPAPPSFSTPFCPAWSFAGIPRKFMSSFAKTQICWLLKIILENH